MRKCCCVPCRRKKPVLNDEESKGGPGSFGIASITHAQAQPFLLQSHALFFYLLKIQKYNCVYFTRWRATVQIAVKEETDKEDILKCRVSQNTTLRVLRPSSLPWASSVVRNSPYKRTHGERGYTAPFLSSPERTPLAKVTSKRHLASQLEPRQEGIIVGAGFPSARSY